MRLGCGRLGFCAGRRYTLMKIPSFIPLLLFVGICIVSTQTNSATNVTAHVKPPPIYDESADGAKQIAVALETATNEHKRVLLMFGANWCGWCHKLHALFESDQNISAVLKAHFVVVMVDVNKGHNSTVDATYGNPTKHGLPVIVVLDADGKQLTTEDTGLLEEGNHHSPQKVLAFLKEWTPKR
jgi:thioredoxin-related protein